MKRRITDAEIKEARRILRTLEPRRHEEQWARAVLDIANEQGNLNVGVYCVECGAITELECICDDLNHATD